MRVALVYDRVNKFGGAERILLVLHEIWPNAPLYTAVYDDMKAPWAKVFPEIIPSFLQRLPFAKSHHELYPYLMPLAFESFDFSNYELVVSVTSEAAKGIITHPKTTHISYILTPTRYLWSGYKAYFENPGFGIGNIILKAVFPYLTYKLRHVDHIASQRPDHMLTISQNVQRRIKKYYQREVSIIYPPVDTDFFIPSKKNKSGKYFLLVSRLVSYKRIDIAVSAFDNLPYPLVIVGTGSYEKNLKKMSSANIHFAGSLTDEKLLGYYQNCIALIFTSEEDLGLTPLEAQSCGKPIISYRGGGALETTIEGKTGEFYDSQNTESLRSTIQKFMTKSYSTELCRKNALKFNKERFKKEFKNHVMDIYKKIQK